MFYISLFYVPYYTNIQYTYNVQFEYKPVQFIIIILQSDFLDKFSIICCYLANIYFYFCHFNYYVELLSQFFHLHSLK